MKYVFKYTLMAVAWVLMLVFLVLERSTKAIIILLMILWNFDFKSRWIRMFKPVHVLVIIPILPWPFLLEIADSPSGFLKFRFDVNLVFPRERHLK